MKEKLSSYAQDQLPGGCYWEPDQQVQEILRELKAKQRRMRIHTGIERLLNYCNPKFTPDGSF